MKSKVKQTTHENVKDHIRELRRKCEYLKDPKNYEEDGEGCQERSISMAQLFESLDDYMIKYDVFLPKG